MDRYTVTWRAGAQDLEAARTPKLCTSLGVAIHQELITDQQLGLSEPHPIGGSAPFPQEHKSPMLLLVEPKRYLFGSPTIEGRLGCSESTKGMRRQACKTCNLNLAENYSVVFGYQPAI